MICNLPPGLRDTLLWSEDKGYGWHSAPPMNYSGAYFANYQKLDATPMGEALTQARLELVSRYIDPSYGCDIGIGGGLYVERSGGSGFDVCQDAITWLEARDAFRDETYSLHAATCWDSLEHMPQPEKLLARVREWLFVSLPTFEDAYQALRSKHYKPGEHLFYWSVPGLINWAEDNGFRVVEVNNAETELGRGGITSFAFKRVV